MGQARTSSIRRTGTDRGRGREGQRYMIRTIPRVTGPGRRFRGKTGKTRLRTGRM
jgi:hypothetical protein